MAVCIYGLGMLMYWNGDTFLGHVHLLGDGRLGLGEGIGIQKDFVGVWTE
jgi:hypothetical protein